MIETASQICLYAIDRFKIASIFFQIIAVMNFFSGIL